MKKNVVVRHDDVFQRIFMLLLVYEVVFLFRILKVGFLISRWRKLDENPTLYESKIEFYSFFTVGLVELVLQITGTLLIFRNSGIIHQLKFKE
jgi:hypothetical protein